MVEHRTAWVIASLCLLLVAIVSLKPDLFEFTSKPEPITQSRAPEVATTMSEEIPIAEPVKEAQKETVPVPVKPAVIDAQLTRVAPVAKKDPPVKSPPPVKPAAAKIPISPATGFYIQLGAFKERARAQGQVDQLRLHGWDAVIYRKKNNFFAVLAGPRSTRSDAATLQKSIERKMKSKGFIVYHKEG